MTDLSNLSDAELLAATAPLDTSPNMRTVICRGCGEVFEVPNERWNIRDCPACRREKSLQEYRFPRHGNGSGVKQGRVVKG